LEVAFDKFGGHAELRGDIDYSMQIHLNVIFGVDANGAIYLETTGGPEVVIDNIVVHGTIEGDGRLGFLSVHVENGVIHLEGVQLTIDLQTNQPGGTLGLDDLTPAGLFAASHISASGAASVSADVAAAAILPGMDEPFDLGT